MTAALKAALILDEFENMSLELHYAHKVERERRAAPVCSPFILASTVHPY